MLNVTIEKYFEPDLFFFLMIFLNVFHQLHNTGPSVISKADMDILWPQSFSNGTLLYVMSYEVEGPIQCHTDGTINPLNLTVSVSE